MTRFEKELSGALGAYWKKEAEKELERVSQDIKDGNITIDENGVARNCKGRALQSDMLEKVLMVSDLVSAEATKAECKKESIRCSNGEASEIIRIKALFLLVGRLIKEICKNPFFRFSRKRRE